MSTTGIEQFVTVELSQAPLEPSRLVDQRAFAPDLQADDPHQEFLILVFTLENIAESLSARGGSPMDSFRPPIEVSSTERGRSDSLGQTSS